MREEGLYGLAIAGERVNSACRGLMPTKSKPFCPAKRMVSDRQEKSPIPQLVSE